jgi:hypothetical protein
MALPADQLSRVPPPEDPHHVPAESPATDGQADRTRTGRSARGQASHRRCCRSCRIGDLEHLSGDRSGLRLQRIVTWRGRKAELTVGFRLIAGARCWPSFPGLSSSGRCPMTTAAPSTALATIQPAFTDAERFALAGFLAGYRGLTREAYALDLRQFTTWCRARSVSCSPSAAPTSRPSPVTWRPGAAHAGPRRAPGPLPGRPCPPAADRLRGPCRRAGPQRTRRPAGRRRTRTASRARAGLTARTERATGIRGHRRGHRAPGPGTRAPDSGHHP